MQSGHVQALAEKWLRVCCSMVLWLSEFWADFEDSPNYVKPKGLVGELCTRAYTFLYLSLQFTCMSKALIISAGPTIHNVTHTEQMMNHH